MSFAGDGPVTVPFEYVAHAILVPVQLSGPETKYLMLDTGSDVTMLDDDAAAGLKTNANQYLVMGGNGADIGLGQVTHGLHLPWPA